MSPFREPPAIELGPLDVGLGRAARRALVGLIPSGGRLIAPDEVARTLGGIEGTLRGAPHAAGVLGSLGLVLVGACAFIAATGGWELHGAIKPAVTVALVLSGGLSLAAVLRAADAPRQRLTLRGAVVGRAARRALRNALRLSRLAARAPERFGPRHVAALRRTVAMLADPLVVAWIPADVRGRAELLLARAIASSGGARWAHDAQICAEIRGLLLAAADHLVEPAPAEQDLRALADRAIAAAVAHRAPQPPQGGRIAARAGVDRSLVETDASAGLQVAGKVEPAAFLRLEWRAERRHQRAREHRLQPRRVRGKSDADALAVSGNVAVRRRRLLLVEPVEIAFRIVLERRFLGSSPGLGLFGGGCFGGALLGSHIVGRRCVRRDRLREKSARNGKSEHTGARPENDASATHCLLR